jgi:hypothetical protein
MQQGVHQVLRSTACAELEAQGCKPDGQDADGEWWRGPGEGPRFMLQYVDPQHMFADEAQLRRILQDIAHFRPLRDPVH